MRARTRGVVPLRSHGAIRGAVSGLLVSAGFVRSEELPFDERADERAGASGNAHPGVFFLSFQTPRAVFLRRGGFFGWN